jgi:hypothetical protein
MIEWLKQFMDKQFAFGLTGSHLMLIGLLAFILGVLGKLIYRRYRKH